MRRVRNADGRCQFGGNPDCSQCGCVATAGLEAAAAYRLPGIGIRAGSICEASLKVGSLMKRPTDLEIKLIAFTDY